MTTDEKLKMLECMTDEVDKDILSTYLFLAESVVLNRLYPYGTGDTIPDRYNPIHVEIAAYMLNKRGAEGETSHSENGVTRNYEDGDIPPTLLRRIIPQAEVLS